MKNGLGKFSRHFLLSCRTQHLAIDICSCQAFAQSLIHCDAPLK